MSRARSNTSRGGAATSTSTVERISAASWCEERGEEARVEGASCECEIPDHEAHRLTDVPAGCQAARGVLEQRRSAQESLHQPAHKVLRSEARAHRPVVV